MMDRGSWAVLIWWLSLFFLLFGYTLEQEFVISKPERYALIRLRSTLGLRGREWPIKSDPCSSWVGIQCRNGNVTEINISRFRRTRLGMMNPQFSVHSLQNLPHLSSFNASHFLLPGQVPVWFGLQLNSLQVLDLRSCSINGPIPYTLGNLSSLVELYLSDNNLTGIIPPSLGQLFRLSVLDLSQNFLTGSIPDTFSNLLNLTVLDMSMNFLSDEIVPGLGSLSRLQSLNFSGNSLSSSIPASLGGVINLVELDLGFNSFSGSLPSELAGLRNLQRLDIGNNLLSGSLQDSIFQSWNQLQFLVLSRNSLSGIIPDELWSMPLLQFLDLSSNNFTGLLPNMSSNANLSTASFNLSDNQLFGNLTPLIGRFAFIDLSRNYFQGMAPILANGNVSLAENCLRNLTDQRSTSDCSTFYTTRNLVFDNFGVPLSEPRSNFWNRHRLPIILASVLGGVVLIVLVLIIIFFRCKRKEKATTGSNEPVPVPSGSSPGPRVSLDLSTLGDAYTYQQIIEATGELNDMNLIKHGHSGDLFTGRLDGGIPVIIKKIDLRSSAKKDSYKLELEILSKVNHPRLVPLLGHCLENENEKFIIYKQMPYGDLASSLFKKTKSGDDGLQSLDWITRLKIAIGAAEALSYLHHECSPPLVHRDIQSSSILLDDKYEVRLGSLSEVCYHEGDTYQRMFTRLLRLPQASEQGTSGNTNATCAYDVFCFGKVLLELVTGKIGISSSTETVVKEFLEEMLPNISIYDKDLVTNIVDPSLIIDEDHLEEVWAMAIVARSCLNPRPNRRPLMRYILKALENPLKVVREDKETSNSARLRATSSRSSWNAVLFGSWRRSSSDVAPPPAAAALTSFPVEGAAVSEHPDRTKVETAVHHLDDIRMRFFRSHWREIRNWGRKKRFRVTMDSLFLDSLSIKRRAPHFSWCTFLGELLVSRRR